MATCNSVIPGRALASCQVVRLSHKSRDVEKNIGLSKHCIKQTLAQHLAFAGIATRQFCGEIDHPVFCMDIVYHTRVDIWSVIDNDPCNYTAGDTALAQYKNNTGSLHYFCWAGAFYSVPQVVSK